MSSGACRALVALALTLVALLATILPAAARSDELNESSIVTYKVVPADGEVQVRLVFTLRPTRGAWSAQPWGPIVVERQANYTVSSGATKGEGLSSPVPASGEPWKAVEVDTKAIGRAGSGIFQVAYDLATGSADQPARPIRVDESYFYICIPGQDTDSGVVQLTVDGSGWQLNQSGTTLEAPTSQTYSLTTRSPRELFTCVEGTRVDRMLPETRVLPDGREILFLAWESDPGWLPSATAGAEPVLRDIAAFLGQPIPGEGPVVVRETPSKDIGGYANAHDSPGVVQLDDRVTRSELPHQMAHAWFGKDNVVELWLREGLAEWIATAMGGEACPPMTANPTDLVLADWQVVTPASPADYRERIVAQEAAACGIVSALRERMTDEAWDDVMASLLEGQTKYIGSAGPEASATRTIDYREWLDAVDERGLIPSAAADEAFAGNRDELDFAQDLLDTFRIPVDIEQLNARSAARERYHAFLDMAAPLGAPHAVRKAMDDWDFDVAQTQLAKAEEVYAAVAEADRLLQEVDVLALVQPLFERAANEEELDAVVDWARALNEGAAGVAGELAQLDAVRPDGWSMPQVAQDAMFTQDFEGLRQALLPAIDAATIISEANEALPQANLLAKYKDSFEDAATLTALNDLTTAAAADRRDAGLAGTALAMLRNEVGQWQIPATIDALIEAGALQAAAAMIADARLVVESAKAADLALPQAQMREEVQPQFEAVTSAEQMAALRATVVSRRADAEAVGDALSTLNTLVPEWHVPDIITQPVAEKDFAGAVEAARTAQSWVTDAFAADEALPELRAVEIARESFESATTLEDLEAGAKLARGMADSAMQVALAIEKEAEPRDMISSFGLWGTDLSPTIDQAKQAAIQGDVSEALRLAAIVITEVNNAGSNGSLRVTGIIFLGVAIVGVLGLWIMLRRQAGPSWARSTTPHWVSDKERGGLFRRKPKAPKAPKPKKPSGQPKQQRRR